MSEDIDWLKNKVSKLEYEIKEKQAGLERYKRIINTMKVNQ